MAAKLTGAVVNFRQNLRWLLQSEGAPSQRHLAEVSGVHEVTISRILSGAMDPSINVAEKLATALGQRLEDLILAPEAFFDRLTAAVVDNG